MTNLQSPPIGPSQVIPPPPLLQLEITYRVNHKGRGCKDEYNLNLFEFDNAGVKVKYIIFICFIRQKRKKLKCREII